MLVLMEVKSFDPESALYGVDNSEEVNRIDSYLLGLAKPKEYSGKKGAEVEYKKNFEEMSLILSKYTGQDVKKISVMAYYQAYEAMKKEGKRQGKGKEKRARRR